MTKPPPDARHSTLGGRLFVRIYATFVVSVLLFTVLAAGFVAFSFSREQSHVEAVVQRIQAEEEALLLRLQSGDLAGALEDTRALGDELDSHIVLFPHEPPPHDDPHHDGRKPKARPKFRKNKNKGKSWHKGRWDHLPGESEDEREVRHHVAQHLPASRPDLRRLRAGLPVIHHQRPAPPLIAVPIVDDTLAKRERVAAVIIAVPQKKPRAGLLVGALLLLLALAGGAWVLADSLSSRLARLERSTDILASGDLKHRATLDRETPRDEVDRLAVAFNEMAERLDSLVTGQRTLLANVSHELRTPIARVKVLIEILGERLEALDEAQRAGDSADPETLARLSRGFSEMQEDIDEVEALIRDLLTSGRLELGGTIEREPVDLTALCERAAARFDAELEGLEAGAVEIAGDHLLLERLLKNLLSNARRACPEGALTVRVSTAGARTQVEVEDEGPGIPADKRKQIFEPFTRLDSARARDQGGVGLGLYLCRQIARAHGATISAEDRRDGRSGARFVLTW
ncbi:periplasmic sensor signal transduction histidine kinase [Plesiocystis pacifica SIR-1]|uniref:histidine kinase n=1 Tax=Plesiocystis pacifica SIR-1 TaxID=391625 RepID=A6G355_9BACT|nr:ATP-binding protein [Plesiocystis pacifica]EDM79680.1 periplasmic sensor signal transduction histidine kinase [Plesiocystis pacifica SIR-1]